MKPLPEKHIICIEGNTSTAEFLNSFQMNIENVQVYHFEYVEKNKLVTAVNQTETTDVIIVAEEKLFNPNSYKKKLKVNNKSVVYFDVRHLFDVQKTTTFFKLTIERLKDLTPGFYHSLYGNIELVD